jgi:hypothetical protein
MKNALILALLVLPMVVSAQSVAEDDSCKFLRDYYEMVSKMKFEGEPPYAVRIPANNMADICNPGHGNVSLYTAGSLLNGLQRQLDISYRHFEDNELWELREFDIEEKTLSDIRTECPTINLKVLEDEIAFYKSKYVPYDQVKNKNTYKRQGGGSK